MTQAYPTGPGFQDRWNTTLSGPQQAGSITTGYGSSRYAPSNTARNLALGGAGLQAIGSLGQAIYGGRQQRRQAEENRRAIGKANLISILSGGSITPAPDLIQSRGSQLSQVLSGVGGSLSSLGDQLQKLRESEITLRMAEDAAASRLKQEARSEEQHKLVLRKHNRDLAKERANTAVESVRNTLANKYNWVALQSDPDSPLHKEIDILQGQQESGHAQLIARQATFEVVAPLFKDAIAKTESNFDYSEIGPEVKSGMYKGDHAYGKYQIMGKNIAAWSKEILGYELTPEEFLNDPNEQEAIAGAKLDSYLKERIEANPHDAEKAVKEASVMWFGGRGNLKHYASKDRGDRQVDEKTGEVTFEGKSNFEYTNAIYDYISERAQILNSYGNVEDRFSDEYTLQRLERKEALEKLMSPEFRQEVMESNDVSPELKDAFSAGLETSIGLYRQELQEEEMNIKRLFLAETAQEHDVRMDAANAIDKQASRHADMRLNTAAQKAAVVETMVALEQDWQNAWAKNIVYKDYKEFIVSYSKLQEMSSRLYDAEGNPISRDSAEYKQLQDDISKGVFDIGFLNTFQRLIDPATVREGDVELYRRNTSGTLGSVWVAIENITNNGALITPEALIDMNKIAEDLKVGMDRALAYEMAGYVAGKERSFAGKEFPKLVKHLEDELFTQFNIEVRRHIRDHSRDGVISEDDLQNGYVTRANLDARYGTQKEFQDSVNKDRSTYGKNSTYAKEFEAVKSGKAPTDMTADASAALDRYTIKDGQVQSAGPMGQVEQAFNVGNIANALPRLLGASSLRDLSSWIRDKEEYPQAAYWRR